MRLALAAGLACHLLSTPVSAQPDLTVTEIVVDPELPSAGEGTLRATVANIGDEATSLALTEFINWTARRDGLQCASGVVLGAGGNDLEAGEMADVETSACAPSTPGTYLILFQVDTDSDVAESNEVNNERAELITWFLFGDGFETGDTARWSSVSP